MIKSSSSSILISFIILCCLIFYAHGFTCFGQPSSSSLGCNNRGICIDQDTCACNSTFTGLDCSIPLCFGFPANSSLVCSSHGKCLAPNTCSCDLGFNSPNCSITPQCFGIPATNFSTVCNSQGNCTAQDTCVCNSNFRGPTCSMPVCFSAACNFNGNCSSATKICTCNIFDSNSTLVRRNCTAHTCFGIPATSSSVCNYQGTCSAPETCACSNSFFYAGPSCSTPVCQGVLASNPQICNGHGTCWNPTLCTCNYGWSGYNCSIPVCSSVPASSSVVCYGHGTCVAPNKCVCNEGYTGMYCFTPICSGDSSTNTSSGNSSTTSTTAGCSGHGTCIEWNKCSCNIGYTGQYCNIPICFGFNATDPRVCNGGYGTCVSPNNCKCFDNNSTLQDNNCNGTWCHGIYYTNTSSVCSGHGTCIARDTCNCGSASGYTGSKCEIPICFGKNSTGIVCSNNGQCKSPDNCICNDDFQGKECETRIMSCNIQSVTFPQGQMVSAYRTSDILLTPKVTLFKICNNSLDPLKELRVKWRQVSGSPLLSIPSTTDQNLFIPRNTIPVIDAVFTFNVTFTYDSVHTSALVALSIPSRYPVAILKGSNRGYTVSDTITLDASGSYDPDNLTPSSQFAYTWMCSSSTSACPGLGSNGSITVSNLKAGQYVFSCSVINWNAKKGSMVYTTIKVYEYPSQIPIEMAVSFANTNSYINPTSETVFEASITSYGDYITPTMSFRWSQTTNNFTSEIWNASIVASTVNTPSLVLKKNAPLMRPGVLYSMSISVSDSSSGRSGIAMVSFRVPDAPSGGFISISPSIGGIEYTTVFTIVMQGWSTPYSSGNTLVYAYSYVYKGEEFAIEGTGATASVRLPAGTISVIGKVYSSYGTVSQASVVVTVSPLLINSNTQVIGIAEQAATCTSAPELAQLAIIAASVMQRATNASLLESNNAAQVSLLNTISSPASILPISTRAKLLLILSNDTSFYTDATRSATLTAIKQVAIQLNNSMVSTFDVTAIRALIQTLTSSVSNCAVKASTETVATVNTLISILANSMNRSSSSSSSSSSESVVTISTPNIVLQTNLLFSPFAAQTTIQFSDASVTLPFDAFNSTIGTSATINLVKYAVSPFANQTSMESSSSKSSSNTIISTVVSITVANAAKPITGLSTSSPILVSIPFSSKINVNDIETSAYRAGNKLICKFWNYETLKWQQEANVALVSFSEQGAVCLSTHLTEFAVFKEYVSYQQLIADNLGALIIPIIIGGIVVVLAVALVLALLAIIVYFVCKKRKQKYAKHIDHSSSSLQQPEELHDL